ncbi:hypothetical protein ACN28S_26995 [Cystobacter fuscus]
MALLAVLRAMPSSASEASAEERREPPAWSFWVEGDYFALPDATDYILWLASADHGLLHLEARYNHEDLRTASTFVGLNFGFGERLRLELTPLAGVVLGRTSGLAPGSPWTCPGGSSSSPRSWSTSSRWERGTPASSTTGRSSRSGPSSGAASASSSSAPRCSRRTSTSSAASSSGLNSATSRRRRTSSTPGTGPMPSSCSP